jgi:hypothetical protein
MAILSASLSCDYRGVNPRLQQFKVPDLGKTERLKRGGELSNLFFSLPEGHPCS